MARKKKNNTGLKIAIGSGSVLLLILMVLGLAYFTDVFDGGQTTIGSSTLSIQKVDLSRSSSECFDGSKGDLWVYTVRAGGLGQWAEASADPDDVSNFYDGKETTENTFKIDTKFDQTCEYPLKVDDYATPVYTFSDPIEWSVGWNLICDANQYTEKCGGTDGYIWGKYNPSLTCFCVKYQKKAVVGSNNNFANPDVHSVFDVEVSNGDETVTKTFDTNGQIKGKVSSDVCAVWQGNLETGKSCPLPASDVLPAYVSGKWKLLSERKYNNYVVEYETFFEKYTDDWFISKNDIRNLVAEVNSPANTFLNSQVNFGTINQPSSLKNAKIIKNLDQLYQYPVVTMYVKADWLGIVTPIPEPKIVSAGSECFGSGRAGTIKVEVKNVGDERGEIDVYAECTNGFDIQSKSISLSAGSSRTVYLELTGSTDEEKLEGACTVFAQAMDNMDERDVDVCVEGHSLCTKGDEWCESGNIWHCPSSTAPEVKENCKANNQVCSYTEAGNGVCKDEANWCDKHPNDAECNDGNSCGYWVSWGALKIPDIWCHINNFFMKFRIAVALVLGTLAGLVGGNAWRRLENKYKFTTRKKWWVAVIVGALVAIAVGYVAYIYFWLGIIMLIVFLIIMSSIRKAKAVAKVYTGGMVK